MVERLAAAREELVTRGEPRQHALAGTLRRPAYAARAGSRPRTAAASHTASPFAARRTSQIVPDGKNDGVEEDARPDGAPGARERGRPAARRLPEGAPRKSSCNSTDSSEPAVSETSGSAMPGRGDGGADVSADGGRAVAAEVHARAAAVRAPRRALSPAGRSASRLSCVETAAFVIVVPAGSSDRDGGLGDRAAGKRSTRFAAGAAIASG